MNFLEKWLGKAEAIAPVSDNRRVMDEALAKLKRSPEPRPAERDQAGNSRAFEAPRKSTSAETIDQPCMCAVWDLPYITRYEKQSNGQFRAKESLKLHDGQASDATRGSRNVTLSVDQIDGDETPCPWCGGKEHYHCSCGAVVCGGRVKGDMFTCRISCGQSWRRGHLVTEIQGAMAQERPQEWQDPPRGSTWSATPQPATATPQKRLLLGPGSQLPGKSSK